MDHTDITQLGKETDILGEKETSDQEVVETFFERQSTLERKTLSKECPGSTETLKAMEESEEREILSPLPQPVAAVVNDDEQNLVMASDPPLFVREMRDQSVKVGSRTRFFTEILTGSPLCVNWLLNGVAVEEGSRYKFYQEIDFFCLEIFPVFVEDEGIWTCQVK